MEQTGSIGIIGGADGPTAIYVTSHFGPTLLLFGMAALFVAGVLIALYVRRR